MADLVKEQADKKLLSATYDMNFSPSRLNKVLDSQHIW